MIKVIFVVGYPVLEFEFESLDHAKGFMDAALATYVCKKEDEELCIKVKHIKSVPEGGNPVMAHSKESI